MFKKKNIFALVSLIFLIILIQGVKADIVSDCGTISTSGYYELDRDITSAGTCLTIATSNVEIDCKGYTIEYANTGTATRFGIDVVLGVVPLSNITIRNCNIIKPSNLNTAGYGIRMQRTSDSQIINNTIQTNGTTNNYGIYLLTSNNNILIENNTIEAYGTSTGNIGIFLSAEVRDSTIKNNIVSGTGTTTSHALHLQYSRDNIIENNSFSTYSSAATSTGHAVYFRYSSERNFFRNNYVYTQGVGTNYAFYAIENSNRNEILNNTFISNGTAASNMGVYISGSDYNLVENNTISTYGTGTNYGISLQNSAIENQINKNIISTYGTSTNNYGIFLSIVLQNNITENNISTDGDSTGNIGIQITSSPKNNILNNTISTRGSTTAYGIGFSGSNMNIIYNNQISTICTATGTTSTNCYGFYSTGSDLNEFSNNNISTSGARGNSGIYTTLSTNNVFNSNYISTYGTNSLNSGITLYTSSNYNTVFNNTFITYGTITNYGVYIYSANRNNVSNNQIFTDGSSTTNYGVYLQLGADRNNIEYNNISTYGTTTNHGLSILNGNGNTFIGNYIVTNGSTITGATNNHGVSLSATSYLNEFHNNTIYTDGGGTNVGIYVLTDSSRNSILGNNINSGGNVNLNYGIWISASHNNTVENNSISTSGSATNHAVYLHSASRFNLINNNNISTSGGTDSHGIYFLFVTPSYPDENIIKSNNILGVTGIDLNFGTALISGTQLINQVIDSYNLVAGGTILIIKNQSYGEIKFLAPQTGTGTEYSNSVYINENSAVIPSTAALNKPAEITFYNLSTIRTNYGIYKNGALCGDCVNLTSMQAGNVTFNVTGAGTYSINGSDEVPHIISLIAPENNTNITGQEYSFNFSVTDETSNLFNCSVYIDGVLFGSNESVSDSIETSISVSGITGGSHEWYVSCLDESNWEQSSETRIIQNNIPELIYNLENNSYMNNINSVLLNITLTDNEESVFDVWIYGDGELINYSSDVSIGDYVYNWEGLSLGQHSWSVIASDGSSNSTEEIQFFNLVNLTLELIAGGDYSTGALVLIQGTLTNGISPINNEINISVYNQEVLVDLKLINSSNSGDFQTSFSGLANGNYTANASIDYHGINFNNSVSFIIAPSYQEGYDAGFIAGNETGYLAGFIDGNITGFNLGNISGFILGNTTGFILGNETGFTSGYALGNTTGFILGNESGYILGNATGFILGNETGHTTGFILGNQTGFIEGNMTGFLLGNETGHTTGFTLGNLTGYILGYDEGNISGFYFGNLTGYQEGYDAGFIAGSRPASLILNKIASFHNLTNETFTYNITLKITNKGGSNATSVNITDFDSGEILYEIGTLESGQTETISYLKAFERNSTTYSIQSSIAESVGIDSFSNNLISANSTLINLTIPSTETGQQLIVLKNIYYNNQTSRSVNYTIEIEVINSGGIDLTGISILDLTDLSLSEIINLNRTQTWNYSGSVVIDKAQSNREHSFSTASATANLLTYNSNIIRILIPGYGGGPNDVYILAPTSAVTNTNFNANFSIKNVNPDIGQDFILNYWFLSNDEAVAYSAGTQTLFVGANDSTNSTTISFLAPSEEGIYKIRANVTGEGVEVQATALSTIIISSSDTSETPGGSGGGIITGKAIEEVVCNPPYIRYGKECCLDANNNSICDYDENLGKKETIDPKNKSESFNSDFLDKKEGIIEKFKKSFFGFINNLIRSKSFSNLEKDSHYFKFYSIIFSLIVFSLSSFLLFKIYKKVNCLKKEAKTLKNLLRKEVYSEKGNKIGTVKEIYLEKNKIYGLVVKVKIKEKSSFNNKVFLIKKKHIVSFGDVVIVEGILSEYLEKFKI